MVFLFLIKIFFNDIFLPLLSNETLIINFNPLLVYLDADNLNKYNINILSEEIVISYPSDSPEGVQRILEQLLSLSDSFFTIDKLGDTLSPRLR